MPTQSAPTRRLEQLVDSLSHVPSLPTIVAKVLEILGNPDASAEQASRLIARDMALATRVLRLANSAFYGIPRTIASIDQAVVILGFNTLRSLMVSASVIQLFRSGAASGLDHRRFWRHSVATALVTRLLARRLGRRRSFDGEALFMAGLLHKIGLLVLDQTVPADLASCIQDACRSGRPMPEIEREILGADHAFLGGLLCEKWSLPEELRHPVEGHLEPTLRPSPEPAALVHLASFLCERVGYASFDGFTPWSLDPRVIGLFGIELPQIPELMEASIEEIRKANDFFRLVDAAS